jgi:hypothetical protein
MQHMSHTVPHPSSVVYTFQITVVNFLQSTRACFTGVQRLTVSLIILYACININEDWYICVCMPTFVHVRVCPTPTQPWFFPILVLRTKFAINFNMYCTASSNSSVQIAVYTPTSR